MVLKNLQQQVYVINAFMAAAMHRKRIHTTQLPSVPENWKQLRQHPYKWEFIDAANQEVKSLEEKKTWNIVERDLSEKHQILPLKWVFTYKTDTDGYLTKFKARICVRGDLQWKSLLDTRAATLASKTFRFMMALAAAFDLEIWQADAVAAFVNSHLDEIVYAELPDGFKQPGRILSLKRALYGLRRV